MGLLGISLEIFPEGSYFRKVDCGHKEKDTENLIKYRYAVQKYIKNFTKENPKINSSELKKLNYAYPVYVLPSVLSFLAIKSITGKTGWISVLGSITTFFFFTKHYLYSHNLYYQSFLLRNNHLFDDNMKRALLTGDYRYLKHLVPSNMSLWQLRRNSDMRLVFK